MKNTLSRSLRLVALASALALPLPALAAPKVVASIKPLHSLVAAVMDGVAKPDLLVKGAASPHTYSLKPSDARLLQDAEIVFWMGPGLEAFMEKPLAALSSKATIVEMEDQGSIAKLPFREGGPFEAHDHGEHGDDDHDHEAADADGHHHDDHDEGAFDLHLWLDPQNGKAIAAVVAATLEKADPDNAARYRANAAALEDRLDALDREVAATLGPVRGRPFVVFHDAYQYFEKRYGVAVAGSVTVSPEKMPGADRVKAIHAKLASLGASCIFAEPQFQPALLHTIAEGTAARPGVLDPEGTALTEGPDLYPTLIRNLAQSMRTCLDR